MQVGPCYQIRHPRSKPSRPETIRSEPLILLKSPDTRQSFAIGLLTCCNLSKELHRLRPQLVLHMTLVLLLLDLLTFISGRLSLTLWQLFECWTSGSREANIDEEQRPCDKNMCFSFHRWHPLIIQRSSCDSPPKLVSANNPVRSPTSTNLVIGTF